MRSRCAPRATRGAVSADNKEDDDIPALEDLDDEDDEDAYKFMLAQKQSNHWLIFVRPFIHAIKKIALTCSFVPQSGVLALFNSLFIANFTQTPQQIAQRESTRNLLAQMEAEPIQDRLNAFASGVSGGGFNLTAMFRHALMLEEPCLATKLRDHWVPAMCYASLIIVLFAALVALGIKHALMRTTMAFFPLLPPGTPSPVDHSTLRTAAARFVEYRRMRKNTVANTELVRKMVPLLMYGAVAFFICGVVLKLGTFIWLRFCV
jgi:hypothetical protein